MTALKNFDILVLLVKYIGERGQVNLKELQGYALTLVEGKNGKKKAVTALNATNQHGLVLVSRQEKDVDHDACRQGDCAAEITLSALGQQVYEKKAGVPYADLLDADPQVSEKAIQAALDAAKNADFPISHDPERAKALLKKILGDLYPGGVSLIEYRELYPTFAFGKSEMVFCQGATPDEDYFLVDGFSFARDLKSLGVAIEEWYVNESEEQE